MLGKIIHDPFTLESSIKIINGLNFLDIETTLEKQKVLSQVSGKLAIDHSHVTGYEIHTGKTSGADLSRPAIYLANGNTDGAISKDNNIIGSYLHGLFDCTESSTSLLKWAGLKEVNTFDYQSFRESQINRLADAMEQHINLSLIDHWPNDSKQHTLTG